MTYLLGQTFHENLLQYYLDKVASPAGVALICAGLLLAAITLGIDKFKWPLLTLTIFVGSLSYLRAMQVETGPGVAPEPFATLSSLSQPLTFGAIMLLAIAALKPVPWRRVKLLHPALLALLLVQIVLAMRQVSGGYVERGGTGLAVAILLFFVLGMGVSRWLHDETHIRHLARTVSWLAVAICASCVIVLVLDHDAAFYGGRLTGALDNPQRLAGVLALCIPFSLMLGTDPGNAARSRTLHLIVAGIATVFLLWTASRTGGLALLAGGLVFFRRRLGWGVLSILLLGGIILTLLSMTESEISTSTAMMFRTNNSRFDVWGLAMEQFYQSPLFGVPSDMAVVESSYISVAVAGGIIGLTAFGVLLLTMGVTSWKIASHRRYLGPYKPAVDLVLAVLAQFIVLWAFEGYIVALVTNAMLLLYCILAIGSLLLERVQDLYGPDGLLVAHNAEEDAPVSVYEHADSGLAHAG